MIRTALAIGMVALLCALGVLLYRQESWPAWDGTSKDTDQAQPEGTSTGHTMPPRTRPDLPVVHPFGEVPHAGVPDGAPEAQPAQPNAGATGASTAPSAPNAGPTPPRQANGQRTHRVVEGDSLWLISRRYYGTPNYLDRLVEANHLRSANDLQPGQVLVIPEWPQTPLDADHESTREAEQIPNRTASKPMPPTLSAPAERTP